MSKAATRGSLYVKCIAYSTCRTAYLTELKAVSAMATKMKLGTLMKSASTLVKTVLNDQYKNNPNTLADIAREQSRTFSFITSRQKEVATLVKQYKIK
jgi:hypothetical protein